MTTEDMVKTSARSKTEDMLNEYIPILILTITAALFAAINLVLSHLLGPRKSSRSKLSVYESGMKPRGDARHRFSIKFYLIAMVFIIFDIEVVFLYPWALIFRQYVAAGPFILIEMLVFIGILVLGYIYVWKKGGLTWD